MTRLIQPIKPCCHLLVSNVLGISNVLFHGPHVSELLVTPIMTKVTSTTIWSHSKQFLLHRLFCFLQFYSIFRFSFLRCLNFQPHNCPQYLQFPQLPSIKHTQRIVCVELIIITNITDITYMTNIDNPEDCYFKSKTLQHHLVLSFGISVMTKYLFR